MRRDLERRLRAAEAAGSTGIEFWIEQDDGTVRGPHGEQMTREEVDALARATGTCMIIISEDDARL
jgi:sugar phosphate isomerase/epimerase